MRSLFAALALVIVTAAPAAAGGSWLYPVEDRVASGDEVTYVGYISVGQLGWVEDGPFYAYLRVEDPPARDSTGFPHVMASDIPLGELAVEEWGEPGFRARAAITFTVPDGLEPGLYRLVYCNDPCTEGLGDLIGADVYVGVEFGRDTCRPWSLDEPEIANLAPDALVCGDADGLTAAEILAGAPYADGAVEPDRAMTEAEALAVLGFESRAELDRMRLILAQQPTISALPLAELIGDRQQLIVVDSRDEALSPYVLAAVVLGLVALAVVTVTASRRHLEGR